MVRKQYLPEAGDIIWIDFDPQVGREQGKRRPAVVLSPATYNDVSSLVVVCPVTSVRKGYTFEVPALVAGHAGVVLADQVKSMDWRVRRAVFIEKAEQGMVEGTRERLAALVGIETQG